MKIDFSVKKNFDKGIRIHGKPENQKTKERVTIVLNKKQRSVLSAYCQESGNTISDVIRTSLQMYFDSIGYIATIDQSDDCNQLKLYPEHEDTNI